MEAMRNAWTDERLDDLNHRVDRGFGEVSREFQALRLEMRTEFTAVRSEMRSEIGSVRSEMAAMNRTLVQVSIGALATLVIGFGGTIATVLTQL
jgi:hypothetical protein